MQRGDGHAGRPGINPVHRRPWHEEAHDSCSSVRWWRCSYSRRSPARRASGTGADRHGLRHRRRVEHAADARSCSRRAARAWSRSRTRSRSRCRPASSPAPTSAPARSSSAPAPVAKRARQRPQRTKVLLNVKVRPAATVDATGRVTLGSGQITVATLVFTFPTGFTLSPKITDRQVRQGHRLVRRRGRPDRPEAGRAQRHHGRSARHTAQATASAHRRPRVRPDRRERHHAGLAQGRRHHARRSRPARCSAQGSRTAPSSPPAPRSRTAR